MRGETVAAADPTYYTIKYGTTAKKRSSPPTTR
jgi:hypothetical protein